MKKTTAQLGLFFAFFITTLINTNAQDLYLIIGQSNAAGRDTNFDPNDKDKITQNVNYLADDRGFLKARQPLNRYSTIRSDLDLQGVNFGLEFGKEMYNYNGNTVYLVVNARGGTKIAQWRKDHSNYNYYNEAVSRVDKAMNDCADCTLKGILWHQGEGDVKSDPNDENGYTSSYFSSLKDLIDNFRSDFKDKGYIQFSRDLPFIVGQLAKDNDANEEKNERFNNALKDVDDSDFDAKNVDWVYSKNLETIGNGDDTHFDAASTRELGVRYATIMQQFVSSSSNKEINTNLNITIFPNPTNETIYISGTDKDESFEIFNSLGAKVLESTTPNINTSALAPGYYHIKTNKGRGKNLKFIKD